jgi:hypothetical protein
VDGALHEPASDASIDHGQPVGIQNRDRVIALGADPHETAHWINVGFDGTPADARSGYLLIGDAIVGDGCSEMVAPLMIPTPAQ